MIKQFYHLAKRVNHRFDTDRVQVAPPKIMGFGCLKLPNSTKYINSRLKFHHNFYRANNSSD